jgi:hypothetical protein
MKKNLLVYVTILCSMLLFSCKKDDSSNNGGSSSLGVGKSTISFTSNPAFAGSTTFNASNSLYTHAVSNSNSGIRNITLTATEVSGLNSRSAVFDFYMPDNTSTTSGNITANFDGTSTVIPSFGITSTTGSTAGTTYAVESGTVTITKLSESEIEGTFSGTLTDGGSATLTITNGSFAGKFQ